jgi:outer membrane biosynthesis protein TonB
MSGHVFISHSSENRDEANEVSAFIEANGVKTWIAPRDVRPGMDYSEQLQQAIEECVAFVVLVTDMANKSPYVRAETEMAFSTHKPIFPLRSSDIQPAAGLAFFLKIRHWTDAYGKGRDAAMDRLVLELRTVSGVPDDKTRIAAGATPNVPPESAPAPEPPPALTPTTPPVAAPPPVPPAPAPVTPPAQPMPLAAQPVTTPPVTTPPVTIPPPPPADDEQLAAAVGPKADWYIGRWRTMDEKGSKANWNWAACLASMFWFAYRKMWLGMVLFLVASLVLGILGSASPMAARATLVINILLTFVTGYFGNHWYRMQTERLVAQTAGMERAEGLETLRRRGGVSQPALFVLLGIFVLLTLLALVGSMVQRTANLQNQNNLVLEQGNALLTPPGDKPPVDTESLPELPIEEQQVPQDQVPPEQAPADQPAEQPVN